MSDEKRNKSFDAFKDDIINTYPRLEMGDTIDFSCNPGVSCFGDCCRDINIFLTPYDVLRMKKNLGISSEEFIQKYTLAPEIDGMQRIPLIVLRMSENEEKTCQFLTDKGCSIYDDRPWACRMYPIGQASRKSQENPDGLEFYFLLKETEKCKGHDLGNSIKVQDYIDQQGIEEYDRMNESFKFLTLHPFFTQSDQSLLAHHVQMFFMACYNLDMFRRFLLNSRFFDIMVLEDGVKERIEKDDVEMMNFGMRWLRYSLFNEEGTMSIKPEILRAQEKKLAEEEAAQAKRDAEKNQD